MMPTIGRLDEHRQAARERRGPLGPVERHHLALEALGVLPVLPLQFGELRREPRAGPLGPRLRDAHRNERGAHEQGHEHDGGRRTRDADERFEEVGETHEHGVRAVEQSGDGRKGIEVH